MRTLDEIMKAGIKDSDWTYCKAEYAPHDGCKIGMPEEYTPDGTTRVNVKTCYIVTAKYRDGEIRTFAEMMYLSDGRFYFYDNLWHNDEVVDKELSGERYSEPIAWIPYRNIPECDTTLPAAPCNETAVPTPRAEEQEGEG